jgi:hypothetical protein
MVNAGGFDAKGLFGEIALQRHPLSTPPASGSPLSPSKKITPENGRMDQSEGQDTGLVARTPPAEEARRRPLPEDPNSDRRAGSLVYVTEPSPRPVAGALRQPEERIRRMLDQLMAEFDRRSTAYIKEVAGG